MNLSAIFIKRPIMTTLVMITILFFGILAYDKLPFSDLPDFEYPTIEVSTSYPGASPDTMADTVTSPLERQFTSIDGIKSISSNSVTGESTIVLQFTLDKSIDSAAQDVQTKINAAQQNLPPDLPNNPTYKKANPAQSPIIYYAISSDTVSLGELYDYAYLFMGQRLGMVDGVSEIEVYGAPFAVRVQIDPDAIAAREIGIDQVAQTIIQGNPQKPVGTLYGPTEEYTINVDGQIPKAAGYNNLVVRNNDGAMVKVSDLGLAHDSLQNDKYSLNYYTQDKEVPCVVIAVKKQAGANTLSVIKGIKTLLPSLQKELPASITMDVLFDQSLWIYESMDDVKLTLIVAFLLVVLVVFFYLGKLINTIIPVLALPMSIIGTFCVMYLLGYSIDILSLLAITLSVGFLIDDAVVVLENITRYREMGEDRVTAALKGSKQISFTILSMTLCLASVFIPMVFMAGIMGKIFREFAMTIMIAVLISGFISLTLTPMLCSRFIGEHTKESKSWIERFSESMNAKLLSIYEKGLSWVLKRKLTTLIGGGLSLGLSAFIMLSLPTEFLPADDLGFIQGYTQAADGASPYQMIDYQNQIADIIKKDPNIDKMVAVGAIPDDNQGLFFFVLKPIKDRKPMPEVIQELYRKVYTIPGVQTFLKPYPLINLQVGTSESKGSYQYTLQSLGTSDLYEEAEKIITAMRGLQGFAQVTSNMHVSQPQLNITIDRDRASNFNISANTIEQALSYAYSGGKISTINATSNQYDVIIETEPNAHKDPSVLNRIYLTSYPSTQNPYQKQIQVPLSVLTTWNQGVGPLNINHFNTLNSVTISFDLDDLPLGTALINLEKLQEETLSPKIMGSVQGTADVFKATFKSLSFLFIISLFVIYVILGILYENFIHPLTVISALPPATLGGLLMLVIFHDPLSLYAFVGIIMLIGIVLKNGIMMIDFANEQLLEGKSIEDSIVTACKLRFRPILMTTFAAAMGAVPIALGIGGLTAQSRRPLGLVIVGGLLVSQVLTLFVTPIVFIYLERLREKFSKKSQDTVIQQDTD